MYSFKGCYSINDICLNNFFIEKTKKNTTVKDCINYSKINDAPFFILTNGNRNKAECYLGKDLSVNNNISLLSKNNNKLKVENISNKDLSKTPNICGYNNNNNDDIYTGSNGYSLYISNNTSLMYKNKNIINKQFKDSKYFRNWLLEQKNNFDKLNKNLKLSYLEYIRSKCEAQVFNDIIAEPKIVKNKKENLFQTITDMIRLDNQYNNIITELIQNSKIVKNKIDIFQDSTSIVGNNLSSNLEILDKLLDSNKAYNVEIVSNSLKKYVLLSENIILVIVIIILIMLLKKNK